MKWAIHGGTWIPLVSSRIRMSDNELVEGLFTALRRKSTPEFEFAKNLNVSPETFRRVAQAAQRTATPCQRSYADFVVAYGSECCVTKEGTIQDTALRTMSGAGHQHFLGTFKTLAQETTSSHLHVALFGPWDNSDKKLGLRWDPEEDRRYALGWGKPAGKPTQSVWGANRLAVEGLPLLATGFGVRTLETTGFTHCSGTVSFTWPLWTLEASVDTVRSLLGLSELQKQKPNRESLLPRGIAEVFRCERITVGKYRNLTQARPV